MTGLDGTPGCDFLTLQQASARHGVSVKTIRRRINEGSLPARRLGVRTWVRRQDLDRVELRRPSKDTVAERRARALHLRSEGRSLSEIATSLGYRDAAHASRDIRRAQAASNVAPSSPAATLMGTSAETWKPLPGAESSYLVSDCGNIVSTRRKDRVHLLKPWQGPCGLKVVNIVLDGHVKNVRVGTLVAKTFLGDRPEGRRVRHLNGNPLDDRLENLAYGSPTEVDGDHVARARREEAAGAPTHCPDGHRYSDSWFGNYGDRLCNPCAWARQGSYKDTAVLAAKDCSDCGRGLPPVFGSGSRKRCDSCAVADQRRRSREYKARKRAEARAERAPQVHHCQDCAVELPPKTATGPARKRCASCQRAAQVASSRRYRRKRATGQAL